MAPPPQSELLGLNLQELTKIAVESGEAPYRGRQLWEGLYRGRAPELEEISTLPKSFCTSLGARGYRARLSEISKRFVSSDGTVRYLIGLADGQSVETVWMPDGDGGEAGDGSEAAEEGGPANGAGAAGSARSWRRATICVSSQVGCAVNCQFCLTAQLGVRRNLSAGEIVAQVLLVLADQQVETLAERINLVFMGMGEPFLNYDEFMKAVRLLVEAVEIPQSRMTVSTAGIVPRIYDFGREPIRPKLAISLNAPDDAVRTAIMPINRKWKLDDLLAAAREFPLRNRERLTFEYVLLNDVNDSAENARELVRLVHGIRCKVNLIALNPGPGIPYGTPSQARIELFQDTLMQAGIPAFVRRPRGRDIFAACGQLKRTEELVSLGT